MMPWVKIEVADSQAHLIVKFKQYKNANIVKSVYYGKTRPSCTFILTF